MTLHRTILAVFFAGSSYLPYAWGDPMKPQWTQTDPDTMTSRSLTLDGGDSKAKSGGAMQICHYNGISPECKTLDSAGNPISFKRFLSESNNTYTGGLLQPYVMAPLGSSNTKPMPPSDLPPLPPQPPRGL